VERKMALDIGSSELPNSCFHLLLDPPAQGAWNMAVDEALLESAAFDGQCTLRFYQWAEPTLSLGYFQAYRDRNQHEASRGCAVVRRASGGGAIMHDFDVTYSLAVPERHPLAKDRLGTYRVVHDALVAVLADRGIEASLFACNTTKIGGTGDAGQGPISSPSPGQRPGESSQLLSSVGPAGQDSPEPLARWANNADLIVPIIPGRCPGLEEPSSFGAVNQRDDDNVGCGAKEPNSLRAAKEPFLCFQRRASGDVLVKGEKIAGSAQRRCRGAVLQHGSVLLARSAAAPELNGLKELTAKTILVEEFIQAWLEKLSAALGIVWRRGDLSEEHRLRAARLVAEKYESTTWTNAR
jgi:lipoate-protein ligase A